MGAFDRVAALYGPCFERILAGRVAIFGVGGVGGWCAECLARSGVGHLTLVDFDEVEETNVNRQVTATSKTVGLAKVEVLAERLRDINPGISLNAVKGRYTRDTAGSFNLVSCNVVIDAIDSIPDKADLIRHALSYEGVELFSSMGAALRFNPLMVRAGFFADIAGDHLAKSLRHQFRRTGGIPDRPFKCVWSAEHGAKPVGGILASAMQVTAVMGLNLAHLALESLASRPQN